MPAAKIDRDQSAFGFLRFSSWGVWASGLLLLPFGSLSCFLRQQVCHVLAYANRTEFFDLRIKGLVLQGRVRFTEKAREEMDSVTCGRT